VIHIDIDEGSDQVRIRALTHGDTTLPFGESLHDPDLYSRVLRGAFKLEAAHDDCASPELEDAAEPA